MNFEDFFDKGDSKPENFRPSSFDRPPTFMPPRETNQSASVKPLAAFLAGLTSVVLLSLTEGTLAWVIFESLEDFGVIDKHLPWNPFVIIAFSVNLIRVFDKAAFGRK